MTSNGFEGYATFDPINVGGAEMTAQDKGDRRPAEYAYAVTTRTRAPCQDLEAIGQEAAGAHAGATQGAGDSKQRRYPISSRTAS